VDPVREALNLRFWTVGLATAGSPLHPCRMVRVARWGTADVLRCVPLARAAPVSRRVRLSLPMMRARRERHRASTSWTAPRSDTWPRSGQRLLVTASKPRYATSAPARYSGRQPGLFINGVRRKHDTQH